MIGAVLGAVLAQTSPVWAALPEADRAALSACEVGPAELEEYLALSYREFDQDFEGGGWRSLSREGCKPAAAALIAAYVLHSQPSATEGQKILRWHAGQMLAGAERRDEALAFFLGAYEPPDPDDDRDEKWNFYVDATVAFVKGDYEALLVARDGLAAYTPSPEEVREARARYEANPEWAAIFPDWERTVTKAQNMRAVEGFIACFDEPYDTAYHYCDADGPKER